MYWLSLILLLTQTAVALEKEDVMKRFQLVGVVGESNHKGIVVLRDVESQRSLRLRLGQLLPTEQAWMLTSITSNSITLQNKKEKAYITYAPQETESPEMEPEDSKGTSFFLLGEDDESTFIEKLEQLSKPRLEASTLPGQNDLETRVEDSVGSIEETEFIETMSED
jgi:hypothetical protein